MTPEFAAEIEPCPFCDGSGQRLRPPPPGQEGRVNGVRRHGKESTYTYGCRCALCRAAHREYAKERKRRLQARTA